MITKEEIINLANLARIEVSEEEAEKLTTEVDSILVYVAQIKEALGDFENSTPLLRNVMREDVVTNSTHGYTEKLLGNAPKREGDYLVVKKILG